ncbi:MAG: hypothetical protein IAE97_14875 [Chthoniobacterales bacterium]|nr:hypothetical protein [Chthoniobacterales bacterium]
MQINARQIDDFKTDRKDIMPPLPPVMRLVPILFYLSICFSLIVGALAIWNTKRASTRYDEGLRGVAETEGRIAAVKAERAALDAQIKEAADLEDWVVTAMPLQPLLVSIIRSMAPKTSIVDLTLDRDAENPTQLKLALRLNAESDKQLDKTLEAIRAMNYREFSPTQTMVRGDLDYRANLVWVNPGAGASSAATKGGGQPATP